MAKLHGLIRLRDHELDEKRRILAELNDAVTSLENQKNAHLQSLEREKKLVEEDATAAQHIANFIDRTLKECDRIDQKIAILMVEVEKATDAVREAFLELKRLQVTQDQRDKKEAKRLAKLERDILDEIGLDQFQRQRNES